MKMIILVALVVLAGLLPGLVELPVIALAEDPPPAELDFLSLEQYLLFDTFGKDISAWTPAQFSSADDLFRCVEEWWAVATEDQLLHTPRMRVTWICWEKVYP